MNQIKLITGFVGPSKYYLVKYDNKNEGDFGKILQNDELMNIDVSKNEIYRSIYHKNGDCLFVIDLKPKHSIYIENQLELLLNTLNNARAIENVYPNIFTWAFDGLNIKGYAIVPSSKRNLQPLIGRYGGTENFIKCLKHHLQNIIKLKKGEMPDYNFSSIKDQINDTELAIGSINKKTLLYNICIDITGSFASILKNSKYCRSFNSQIEFLDLMYWRRELNPDFISESKLIKLENPIPLTDEIYKYYPKPILRMMKLKRKGNYNRFLLARFFLSVHNHKDAKFLYYSVLGDEELKHVKEGDCVTQWPYIVNNLERYSCPSMKELESFIHDDDKQLTHPLELLTEYKKNAGDKK